MYILIFNIYLCDSCFASVLVISRADYKADFLIFIMCNGLHAEEGSHAHDKWDRCMMYIQAGRKQNNITHDCLAGSGGVRVDYPFRDGG
jgi:hypothetical protein